MYNRRRVEMMKERYPEGTRICLDSMQNDPRPIPPGTKGTVDFVDDMGTLHCKFDNGRSLGVIPGEDNFHTIQQEETEELSEEPEINMSM
jgi:hypothetical protein